MKPVFIISCCLLFSAGNTFSQIGCTNDLKIQSPVVQKPTDAGIVSVTCSTMVVKWKGAQDQTYLVTGTFISAVPEATCDKDFNCWVAIPVTPSSKVSWSVQAASVINERTFYSYPLRTNQEYLIPDCPVNLPPIAFAGVDFSINSNSTILNAWGSYDPEGKPVTFFWEKKAGPEPFNMLYERASTPVVSNLVNGTYTFHLTVADEEGVIATDEVDVLVSIPVTGVVESASGSATSKNVRKAADLANNSNIIKVLFYPNPALDVLSINWNSEYNGNARLTVMDASGKAVKMMDIRKQRIDYTDHIKVANLKPGIYYIRIKMENGASITTTFLKD